jgi:hypothetical protein
MSVIMEGESVGEELSIPKIIKIVQILNEYISQQAQGSSTFFIEVITNGEDCIIEFLGSDIWHKDEDLRPLDGNGVYEPLEDFLKKECNQIIKDLQSQKFK